MRTVAFQIEVNKNILDNDLNKLRTSINNLQKNHSAYQAYIHVQDDALKVVLDIEKYLLLQLMRDSDEILLPAPDISLMDDVTERAHPERPVVLKNKGL